MSGLFALQNICSRRFDIETITGQTLNAAGGAVISKFYNFNNLRRIDIAVTYTNPTAPVKIRCLIYAPLTKNASLAFHYAGMDLLISPTSLANKVANFAFLNSDIFPLSDNLVEYCPDFSLYNNATINPVDADGLTVNTQSSLRQIAECHTRIIPTFRLLLQNMDATNNFATTAITIRVTK